MALLRARPFQDRDHAAAALDEVRALGLRGRSPDQKVSKATPVSAPDVSESTWYIVDVPTGRCLEEEPQTKWIAGHAGIDTPQKYFDETRADHIPARIDSYRKGNIVIVTNESNDRLTMAFARGKVECEAALKPR